MTETMTIHSRIRDYTVFFQKNFTFFNELSQLPNLVLIIDRNVYSAYNEIFIDAFAGINFLLIDATEENKNFEYASSIYEWIISNFSAKKNLNLVSFGGGIVQDITGFVASTLFRGINWIFVPSTLLAQVDSCIGGKTYLNFKEYKNLLGSFYPPASIHIAPAFIETLSNLDIYSGYGEIIKFLLMKEAEHGKIENLERRVNNILNGKEPLMKLIQDCLNVKCSFMKGDEFDCGKRNLLNYGHCFGHALEAASNYYVPHGIAVNIGIIFANIAAVARNYITQNQVDYITKKINLPLLIQPQRQKDYSDTVLLNNLKNDKKRIGKDLPLVIISAKGLIRLTDFTEKEFSATLDKVKGIIFPKDKRS